MADLSWVAKRPIDSSLDTSKARAELVEKPLPLNEALRTLKAEVLRAEFSQKQEASRFEVV
jgi:dTDP-4-dehydrorhamnose reductase